MCIFVGFCPFGNKFLLIQKKKKKKTSSHASLYNLLSDKVAIHADVLGPLMENWVR